MSTTLRSIISFIIAILCMTIVYFSMKTYEISPKGVVLPSTDIIYPPYQGKVHLYSSLTEPFNATVIGNISIEYHNIHPTFSDENKIINKAKVLAAQSGGNGLIFSLGHSVKSTQAFLQELILRGTVIKTNEQAIQ